MKFMTFNSSCTYCCLANMLLDFNIDIEDYQIVIGIGLPYIIMYDDKSMSFLCGSSLQDKNIFNLYLEPKGLLFIDELLERKKAMQKMKTSKKKYIIGLNNGKQKHAHVFLRYDGSNFLFLNPHRINDGETDYLILNEHQLSKMLDDELFIGHIVKTSIKKERDYFLHRNSINVLDSYKIKIQQFSFKKQSIEDIKNNREPLLRAFAIDLLSMMEIIEDDELLILLKQFQKDCLALFKVNENTIPSEIIDLNNFFLIIDLYKERINYYIRKTE